MAQHRLKPKPYKKVLKLQPDVAILYIHMPRLSGLEAAHLCEKNFRCQSFDHEQIRSAELLPRAREADGYLDKACIAADLTQEIKKSARTS